MIVRAAGYQGTGSVHTGGLLAFGRALERDSLGAVTLALTTDVTRDGSPATSLLARAAGGQVDVLYFASSYLAAAVPALAAFDLPFAVTDRAAACRWMDGAPGRHVADAVARNTPFRVLGFWDNGFRHLSNGVRPLAHPGDCRGLVIRTLDSALHQAVFRALGFIPVTVDVAGLAEAVRCGRVDAQENPLANTAGFGLHAWHRWHSLTGHFLGVALLLANRAWFDALPGEVRALVHRAAAEATTVQRGLAMAEEARALAVVLESGAGVLQGAELDLGAFRDAVAGVRDAAYAALDPALRGVV